MKLNLHNLYECRYIDVLIEKMLSTLTERNNINLKTRGTDHIFNMCFLRIFALHDTFPPQEQRIEVCDVLLPIFIIH